MLSSETRRRRKHLILKYGIKHGKKAYYKGEHTVAR